MHFSGTLAPIPPEQAPMTWCLAVVGERARRVSRGRRLKGPRRPKDPTVVHEAEAWFFTRQAGTFRNFRVFDLVWPNQRRSAGLPCPPGSVQNLSARLSRHRRAPVRGLNAVGRPT
jgi:hypothetical protein